MRALITLSAVVRDGVCVCVCVRENGGGGAVVDGKTSVCVELCVETTLSQRQTRGSTQIELR